MSFEEIHRMATSEAIEARASATIAMTARQRLTAVLLLGTNFMLSVDFSILNIALPEVGRAVGLDLADFPWVATAFALPAAGLSLLAARALQGIATAMTAPAALALLITAFADDRQRARVLGLNGTLLSAGFTVGALAGGMLVDVLSWRWAFLINVPFALAILALTFLVIPVGRSLEGVRLDIPGAVSVTFGLLAIVFGIIEWFVPALIAGLLLLALFFWIERRATAPQVAIEMLARPSVRWGNLAALTMFSMEAGLVFLMTLYLQEVLHFRPLATGLIFGVPGLASVAAGVVAGRIIARRGARPVLLVALLIQGGLTAPLILLGPEPAWLWLLVPALFIGFLGHITAVVAATVIATSEVADADAGVATGLVTTSQRVAGTVGIPLLGAMMALRADLPAGIQLALAVDVALTLTVVAMVSAGLGRPSSRTPG
jgi:MFS family permease